MLYFLSIIDQDSIQKANVLKDSIQKWGYNLTLLTNYDKSIGNYSKVIKPYEWMQNMSFSDDDIIFIIDAFDCVMTSDPKKTIDFFNTSNCDVLISSEVGLNRWSKCHTLGLESFKKYSIINRVEYRGACAGALCGKANKLKEFFKDMTELLPKTYEEIKTRWKLTLGCSNNCNHLRPFPNWVLTSDQYFLSYYLAKIDFIKYQKIKIHLDIRDKIFFNYHYDKEDFKPEDYVFVHVFALKEQKQLQRYKKLLSLTGHV